MSDDLTKPAPLPDEQPDAPTTLPGEIDTPATPTPLPAPPNSRGVTASGWPYVEPDDHPLQYPAVSQALANKLEQLPRIAAGEIATTGATAAAVSFPPGRFTKAPKVVVTPYATGTQNMVIPLVWGQPSASGFQLLAYNKDATPIAWPFHWIAVQAD